MQPLARDNRQATVAVTIQFSHSLLQFFQSFGHQQLVQIDGVQLVARVVRLEDEAPGLGVVVLVRRRGRSPRLRTDTAPLFQLRISHHDDACSVQGRRYRG